MFGLFGPKEIHPLELEGKATILAPARLIFGLLDFSSPANRLKLRDFEFTETSARLGRFSAIDPAMKDLCFEFHVDLHEQDKAYGFDTRITADTPFGAFEVMREEYTIEAIDDRTCRVILKTSSKYREGLSARRRRAEEATMTQAVVNDLARLKGEAEGLVAQYAA